MKYKLVIFDLDGTLLDTSEGILSAVKSTIEAYDLPSLSNEDLMTFIGPPIQNSLVKYYDLDGEELQNITNYFREEYSSKYLLRAVPYEGIYQLLKLLNENRVICAVATYKREDYALKLLKHYNFDEYMTVMYGADNENRLKKKDIIMKCIEHTDIDDLKSVLMVGDTIHDSAGASDIGIDFIGVNYGFGFSCNDKVQYDFTGIADSPMQLLELIINKKQ